MSINNKEQQTVMVVGSGGRCHAIVDALSRSPRVRKIFCAPGNAGIAAQAECVAIQPTDVEGLLKFATENGVDFTVVGPEAALAVGIVDAFTAAGKRIFGPTREAARIESSKEFAKQLMVKYGIPTGYYEVFTDFEPAWEYVRQRPLPAVIKYDGLAAGKGVVVAMSYEEAEQALRDMLLDATFGKGKVIVEEFLDGPEFSFMCVASGEKVYPLALAQDHKRAYDGDRGPNTGGMGAYSPVPFISEEVRAEALEKILKPTAAAMVKEGVPFTGVLYGGLILTKDGPKVIEFNARFGDPETEVVLPRLESDILDLFEAAVDGTDCELRWSPKARLGVVMASEGYPGAYAKGSVIEGLDKVEGKVYHMGT
ncbi:MAG: phosphoribosylamine--glycine ligase, partial [Muribaculaceae bacterium]|nr:phosphoribosylamine--glycine ligase [Muribaculaceae bacterium]